MDSFRKIKTILVTGSNKGIGFGIVKELLKRNSLENYNYTYNVILTSRDDERAKESVQKLLTEHKSEEERLFYHQLDIANKESINVCLEWLKDTFKDGVDILVNNAGVYSKSKENILEAVDTTFATNIYGTIDFTERMLDSNLIKENGKIIILGSQMGTFAITFTSHNDLEKEILDPDLTLEKLLEIPERFRNSVVNGICSQDGWPVYPYGVSKLVINSYPRILMKRSDILSKNIGVYSCHPGWVRTDMGGPSATLSIEEGIQTPMYLIDLEDGILEEYQGKYFDNCKITKL